MGKHKRWKQFDRQEPNKWEDAPALDERELRRHLADEDELLDEDDGESGARNAKGRHGRGYDPLAAPQSRARRGRSERAR